MLSTTVLGWLSWASLLITIIAAGITIWQVRIAIKQSRNASTAAQAAKSAAQSLQRLVRDQEKRIQVSSAKRCVDHAIDNWNQSSTEVSAVYLKFSLSFMNALLELSEDDGERRLVRKQIRKTQAVLEYSTQPVDDENADQEVNTSLRQLSQIAHDLDQIDSRHRYNYRLPDNE